MELSKYVSVCLHCCLYVVKYSSDIDAVVEPIVYGISDIIKIPVYKGIWNVLFYLFWLLLFGIELNYCRWMDLKQLVSSFILIAMVMFVIKSLTLHGRSIGTVLVDSVFFVFPLSHQKKVKYLQVLVLGLGFLTTFVLLSVYSMF